MTAKKLMTTALMTLGLTAAVPTIASADYHDYRDRDYRDGRRVVVEERVIYTRDRDCTENLRYALLPGRIQEAVDFERRGFPVDHIQRVREGGREYYRMVVYGRHADTFVRLDCDGRVLSREEVACERVVRDDYHRFDRAPYVRFHVGW